MNQILVDLAKPKGKGWSEEIKLRNPTADSLQRRIVYVEKVGDTFDGPLCQYDLRHLPPRDQ